MRCRRLVGTAVATAAVFGGLLIGAPDPAFAANCSVHKMFVAADTDGYAAGVYIIAPYAWADSLGCAATSISITIQPAVVGGIPRVATPATCTYPEPAPVSDPNEAYCGPAGGYGSFALGETSYPYITVTAVSVGIGLDGSRSTWNMSCTRAVSEPGTPGATCEWNR